MWTLGDALGDALDSIYVYGSVATGQARVPTSDLDLLVVTSGEGDAVLDRAAAELSSRHTTTVREVGLARTTLSEVRAAQPSGHGLRCFLHHYTIHVAGTDRRRDLPSCRAGRDLAVALDGDVVEAVDALRPALASPDARVRGPAVARTARKLLMTAAVLCSSDRGGWSTDRDTGAELLRRDHPDLAEEVDALQAWARPTASPTRPPSPAQAVAVSGRVATVLDERFRAPPG